MEGLGGVNFNQQEKTSTEQAQWEKVSLLKTDLEGGQGS